MREVFLLFTHLPFDKTTARGYTAPMEKNDYLTNLGPCGLHCGGCFAFVESDIKNASTALKRSLGNFGPYAARFVELLNEPRFSGHREFSEFLECLTNISCKGCRQESCKLFTHCHVRECSREHTVDFCFQCKEFPCDKTGFDEHLQKRWLKINRLMQEIGTEAYYDEIKDTVRYE